ncbi:MAG TPA: ATP-dependent DNA helicase RecG [Gemmatimonadaceae bacterium]|jgi:ATP-dependent DNA helicase RecG|nr:ATP-dependent DNA helicase RecG [Gemmatimonadaceae bacterium]
MEPRGKVYLDMPVNYLKGVGPIRAESLRRLGIVTARDLLFHIPHRYEDASTITPIASLETGMDGTIVGRVISKGIIPTRRGLRIFQAVLQDDSGMIEASWPGQPFLDRTIEKGDLMLLTGSVRFFHGRQLQPREYIQLGKDEDDIKAGKVLAVYPATEGLSFKVIRGIIDSHLDTLLPLVKEYLPPEILREVGLPSLRDAIRMVHRPKTIAEGTRGRARLAFEELLFIHILHRRANAVKREKRSGIAFENRRQLTSALKSALPFTLTDAQTTAIREIVADMTSGRRMHRLLQGDVGSGKTIVALFAALLAMENGYQAAIMAPTELLAEQHARTFTSLLEPLGVEPVLVTGSLAARARKEAAAKLSSPDPVLVVGTHALVQDAAVFGRLGFVTIDEQHRFGVEQRAAISAKGESPDVLLMSATPIPRSLALTVYGDLDVSTLDERPAGRQPVTTVLRPESARERVLDFVARETEKGRQAYVVYPVIEESEKTDLKAATTMYELLSAGPFAGRVVALIHGRVASEEREKIMRAFRDGKIDVLVSTTVIEVGIDVPNATVMLVEHPERFGLSQLHQLRGRVGRGAEASYCILLGNFGEEAAERLRVFVETDDGFEIARADLRLRGMGNLFGQEQSGEATFRVADPVRDEELNVRARQAAEKILERDPELTSKDNAGIRKTLSARYSRALELFRVG